MSRIRFIQSIFRSIGASNASDKDSDKASDKDSDKASDKDIDNGSDIDRPVIVGGHLVSPREWNGPLSGMPFFITEDSSQNVCCVVAEIPGKTEYSIVLRSIVNSAPGLAEALDLALHVAQEPDAADPELIRKNALSLHHVAQAVKQCADRVAAELAEIPRDAVTLAEHRDILQSSEDTLNSLRIIQKRLVAALNAHPVGRAVLLSEPVPERREALH